VRIGKQCPDEISGQYGDLVRQRVVGHTWWADTVRCARSCLVTQVGEVGGEHAHPVGTGAPSGGRLPPRTQRPSVDPVTQPLHFMEQIPGGHAFRVSHRAKVIP
jgi:hypothetical protein